MVAGCSEEEGDGGDGTPSPLAAGGSSLCVDGDGPILLFLSMSGVASP